MQSFICYVNKADQTKREILKSGLKEMSFFSSSESLLEKNYLVPACTIFMSCLCGSVISVAILDHVPQCDTRQATGFIQFLPSLSQELILRERYVLYLASQPNALITQ